MSIEIPKPTDSFLADDTTVRLNQQRLLEQEGLRRLSGKRVIARDRDIREEPKADFGAEEQHGQGLQEHPLLDKQQFDGIDADVNPAPPLSDPESRREYDNARNEQQLQHQLKLGLQPGKSSAPKPPGP